MRTHTCIPTCNLIIHKSRYCTPYTKVQDLVMCCLDSAMAYSATTVLPADVWAAMNTLSCSSRWRIACFWKLSSVNGHWRKQRRLVTLIKIKVSSGLYQIYMHTCYARVGCCFTLQCCKTMQVTSWGLHVHTSTYSNFNHIYACYTYILLIIATKGNTNQLILKITNRARLADMYP